MNTSTILGWILLALCQGANLNHQSHCQSQTSNPGIVIIFKQRLKETTRDYYDKICDISKFRGVLQDVFPEYNREVNAIMYLLEHGIMEAVSKEKDSVFLRNGFQQNLCRIWYGILICQGDYLHFYDVIKELPMV